VALTAVALLVSFRKPRLLAGALVAGTVVALAAQTNLWFTGNYNVTPWKFPRQESFLAEHFEQRYPGTTFVIADSKNIDPDDPTGQWGDVLFGSLYQAAGVEAVNNYAGISFNSFVDDLCINYYGGVPCGDGVGRLLAESPGAGVPWIDAMRIDTIVVQNSGPYGGPNALDALPADRWDVRVEHGVTVGTRTQPYPWPDGRVSAVTPGLEITGDSASTDTHETVTYTGSGTATFALLAWPGWTATVNGEPVDVIESPGGLLQVQLPDSGGAESTLTLQFTPPASGLGWGLAGVGLVLALGQGAWFVVRKRRTHRPAIPAGEVS